MAEETLKMEKKGLFGDKPKQFEPPSLPHADITVLSTRLRVSEERYTDLRRKIQLIEQNMLAHHKKNQTELKTLQNDILEMKRSLRETQDRLVMAIKEIQLTARKEDVDVMRRYVEMWDPIRFVSMEQVEKIVDEKLKSHHEEMHEE